MLEIFRAVQVEKNYDKDEILELYLNFIYLGQGCRGIRSAAATYYGKEVESLTAAECALYGKPGLMEQAGQKMMGIMKNMK